VYKIASGKIRITIRLTTLEKEDGTYTTDTKSTIMHMLENFVPDDREIATMNSTGKLGRKYKRHQTRLTSLLQRKK